jgi:hypothetical protein
MQDTVTAIISLLFMLRSKEDSINKLACIWAYTGCPAPVIRAILGIDFLVVLMMGCHMLLFSNVFRVVSI